MAEQYRLLAELGRGPHTIVHRAWDAGVLKRKVAVKALTDAAAADPATLRRFWSEAEFMAKHRHERLAPVYSVDEEKRWIIMELADGSVAQTIAAGPSPVAEVESVLSQALEGLVALHAVGRIHGQIKPTNLLTYTGGRIKLSDPAGQSDDGTIPYPHGEEKFLAPELINPDRWGAEVGPALDLYTLGFVALEMLAGPRFADLFPGMTAGGADQAMLWTRYHAGEDDPRTLVNQLVKGTGRLSRALPMLVAKDRTQRAASAQAVLDVLGREAIPPQLQQRASADAGSLASAASETSAKPAPPATPLAAGAWGASPVSGESVAPSMSRPVAPAKPFLQDTKKVATVAATIMLLGVAAFIAINAFTEESPRKRIASIESDPPDALVLINEKETKFRTPKRGPVDAGEHSVQVKWADGELSEPQTLSVPPGPPESDDAPLEVRFTRASGSAAAAATTEATTSPQVAPPLAHRARVEPPDAQVFVAGQPVVVTAGAWEARFGPGVDALAVEASAAGYEPIKLTLSRAEAQGRDKPFVLYLNPVVTIDPPDARVLVDGRETPAVGGRFVLPLGDKSEAKVSVAAPGRYALERLLTRASSPADRRFSLSPLAPPDSTASVPQSLAWLKPAGSLVRHSERVRALAVSPDGVRVASAGLDRSLIVVRMDRLDDPPIEYGPTAAVVTALAFSSDGATLFVGALDGSLRSIELSTSRERLLVGQNTAVTSLAAARVDGSELLWASVNAAPPQPLVCYEAESARTLWETLAAGAAWEIGFLSGPRLVAYPVGERLGLYAVSTGAKSDDSLKFEGQAFHVAADDAGRRIALGLDGATRGLTAGQGAGDVLVWSPESRTAIVWTAHQKAVSGLDFVDATTLVSTDRSGEIVVTRVSAFANGAGSPLDGPQRLTPDDEPNWIKREQTERLDDPILISQFHAGSQRLFCGMQDGTVRVFAATPLPADHRPVRAHGAGDDPRAGEREARRAEAY
ncbi:MAG TPA: protein kinase [Pirellulales bacterium]